MDLKGMGAKVRLRINLAQDRVWEPLWKWHWIAMEWISYIKESQETIIILINKALQTHSLHILAFLTIISLCCAHPIYLVTLITFRSFAISSSHLTFGLPFGLVLIGFPFTRFLYDYFIYHTSLIPEATVSLYKIYYWKILITNFKNREMILNVI